MRVMQLALRVGRHTFAVTITALRRHLARPVSAIPRAYGASSPGQDISTRVGAMNFKRFLASVLTRGRTSSGSGERARPMKLGIHHLERRVLLSVTPESSTFGADDWVTAHTSAWPGESIVQPDGKLLLLGEGFLVDGG